MAQLKDAVVVVTGASSGIGRATAHAFARSGAALVLAARHEGALREAARECERLGARALAVPTDTRDEEAVARLAERAIETFGRIDVWVNNAAVAAFGDFREIPADVFDAVIRTNVIGYAHGARAALNAFDLRGGRGTLINVASLLGRVGMGGMSPYVASKFAIRGFSESLRQELIGTGVNVCVVLPAAIDTPIYHHAANYTGRELKPLNPTYGVEAVADAIVSCARHPSPEVVVGRMASVLLSPHALSLRLWDRIAHFAKDDQFRDRPAPRDPGNVFETTDRWHALSGGWPRSAPLYAALAAAAMAAVALPLGRAAWRRLAAADRAAAPSPRDEVEAPLGEPPAPAPGVESWRRSTLAPPRA